MHAGTGDAGRWEGKSLRNAIGDKSGEGLSMVTGTDSENHVKGIITDGDLRRMLEKGIDVYTALVDDVMTKNPKWIDAREMAVTALQRMSDMRITSMPVLDENHCVIGSILMQDIFKAGIVR